MGFFAPEEEYGGRIRPECPWAFGLRRHTGKRRRRGLLDELYALPGCAAAARGTVSTKRAFLSIEWIQGCKKEQIMHQLSAYAGKCRKCAVNFYTNESAIFSVFMQ